VVPTFRDSIAKHVVALLGERQFVDRVMNEPSFQQITCVSAGVAPVDETLNVTV